MIASCYGTHKESLTLKNGRHRQEKFFSSWQTIKKSVDLWSTSGDLSEWFKVRCWKRRVVHATMSSNLIVSARWKAPLHDSGFFICFRSLPLTAITFNAILSAFPLIKGGIYAHQTIKQLPFFTIWRRQWGMDRICMPMRERQDHRTALQHSRRLWTWRYHYLRSLQTKLHLWSKQRDPRLGADWKITSFIFSLISFSWRSSIKMIENFSNLS